MTVHNYELSIGVLAHNEKLNIARTLQSLFTQDVFQGFSVETVIVANGCTDETAALARQSLDDHRAVWSSRGSARVEELLAAGKANAWNEFVHRFSSPQASILIFMDADIVFLSDTTISSMVSSLKRSPEAVICVDRPVKDIELNTKRTIFQQLLIGASPEIREDNVPLCGQLYCVLSSQVRRIKLPVDIHAEDGFLRALILTDGFTKPEDRRRIILDSAAGHRFASVATLRELFNHEKWIVSSCIISMCLYERFWRECAADHNAMKLMEQWQEQDPKWLQRYIHSQVQERGWRLLPRSWWTRRWTRLSELPIGQKWRRLPAAVIAAAADAVVFIAAIREVRRGRAFRYWGRV